MTAADELERLLELAHRRLDNRDAGRPIALPGDPSPAELAGDPPRLSSSAGTPVRRHLRLVS